MTVYADEEYYKNEYLQDKEPILKAGFSYYARDATLKIREYAGENIDEDNIPDCVKLCCCELAEKIYTSESLEKASGGVSSESVGNWSKSYESSEEREKALNCEAGRIIYKWLSGTGLLYRGLA